ncbi:thiamine pyrophosphate-binding protein [Dactylosporangium sp. NPDC051541]|uniref:thiamine pyrophosphate-binding protein n=1 Tax=Dactylosporangium sp. NPDC051541 TaxID=3363977 RepID=UPI0037915E74
MTRRTGARVVADMLDGYGVTHVFLVPAILRRTLAELERHHPHIHRVVTHGEKAAAYMADGYARVSGRPGVAMAQVVGALNLAAGLREPFLAGSPVLALTGGRSPATKYRQVYQEIDDLPAFAPVTKFNATVEDADRFPDMLRHAFRVATTGAPGPVHLQIQGNEGQLDADGTDAEPLVEPGFARVPPLRPAPDEASVAAVLRLLGEARRPVIVAGGGVRASRAGADLVALAEALGIPVATSANGKDTIPGTHPLSAGVVGSYSRECANQVVNRADLVCFIGTQTGGMTTHFWAVPPIGTPAIQIDVEPSHLGRNYPLQAAVAADAKLTLARMLALAPHHARPDRTAWLAEVDAAKAAWRARHRDVLTSDAVPIRPERICAELTAGLPGDAVVVVDTGHAGMWMAQYHDTTAPEQDYLRSAGHLGWAFSAGIGAKCGAPDRPVVVFTGDAGLYYHLGEVETAVRRRINLVTVVNNNHGGNQSKRGFDRAYGGQATAQSRELWTYHEVDFARIAEEMGALGIRVDRPGDLAKALERALDADRPVVLDVHTDIDAIAPLPVSQEP